LKRFAPNFLHIASEKDSPTKPYQISLRNFLTLIIQDFALLVQVALWDGREALPGLPDCSGAPSLSTSADPSPLLSPHSPDPSHPKRWQSPAFGWPQERFSLTALSFLKLSPLYLGELQHLSGS
jgi:hypothetical protein